MTLLESTSNPKEKKALQDKISEVTAGWDEIEFLYEERKKELESAFDESRHFQEQTREMLNWLTEASAFLKTKKVMGGKPDTARAQLEKHKVRCLLQILFIMTVFFDDNCMIAKMSQYPRKWLSYLYSLGFYQ